MERDLLVPDLSVNNDNGHLIFAGMDTKELSKRYGTPLYLYDEERIRENCRTYVKAMKRYFGENGRVIYASKAASFKRMYEIISQEGLSTDVVSIGEIVTAKKAGFHLLNAYFHSNNKTDEDIRFAMDNNIGYFVVDNQEELLAIEKEAKKRGIVQNILLRLTPGIDPHTYDAVSTGKVDSKFGSAIQTGEADHITRLAMSLTSVKLAGFHCHVGSQVFDSSVYIKAADVMLDYIKQVSNTYSCKVDILDLGGGYGVRYIYEQPKIDIVDNIRQLSEFIFNKCNSIHLSVPIIALEPGRSICADASISLYTVGSVKIIPCYKNYVSVDGSMADNIRFALYHAPYTVLPADHMNEPRTMQADVVGRCCESGDILQTAVMLPEHIKRNDLLAFLTTGAYHYSMASNYNMLSKPAVVMVRNGDSFVAVKRQTPEQVCENDT